MNTFDLEPWWTMVPPAVAPADWASLPDRSERPLREFLALCEDASVKATFFVVGWYASAFPARIREIVARGHEVGCHALYHEDVARLSLDEFRATTQEAKDRVEQAAGAPVTAYRAPSFSIPVQQVAQWATVLADLGFSIDSSIATGARVHGGGFSSRQFPEPMSLRGTLGVELFEVPVPGVPLYGRELQVFGGGYLRVAPEWFLDRVGKQQDYQVLYVHPHDFDGDLPRLPGQSRSSHLRRTMKFGDIRAKIARLFAAHDVVSCGELHRSASARSLPNTSASTQ